MKDLKFKNIQEIIGSRLSKGNDDAFFILDSENIRNKYRTWSALIPRVKPFYAVKCNDHESVLKILISEGTGFDCASKKEIKKVLALGVSPEKIIYAHPTKQISHLVYAAENHVQKVTFDCEQELVKIKKYHPTAEVVLRIRYDSIDPVANLGLKFGCDIEFEAPKLVQLCKLLNLNLIGVSFHIGSGSEDYETHANAIKATKKVFKVAQELGFDLKFVDIGGGFNGFEGSMLTNYAEKINQAMATHFPDPTVEFISEPGRYFVESAMKRVVQIHTKRQTIDGRMNYFVNDGIFMAFMMHLAYDRKFLQHGQFDILRQESAENDQQSYLSIIWGNTCCSKDVIIEDEIVPEMEIGDWLIFKNMGAYTISLATMFNGFEIQRNDVIVV